MRNSPTPTSAAAQSRAAVVPYDAGRVTGIAVSTLASFLALPGTATGAF